MKKLLTLLIALLIIANIAPARPHDGKPGQGNPPPPPISTYGILPLQDNS